LLQRFQCLGHGSGAAEEAEGVRDHQRVVAQLAQALLEGRPLLFGFRSVCGFGGEP